MKKLMVVISVTGIFTVMAMAMAAPSPWRTHADVSIKVLDESGAPVEGAEVNIGFRDMHAKGPGKGWGIGKVDYHPAKGKTGADGMFSASDDTSPNVVVTVTKPGYYESHAGVFDEKTETAHKGVLNITLRKIKNSVPMYAKNVNSAWGISKIPVLNQDVGYDLEVGDWVAPYGKGKTSDFTFNMDAEYKSWDNSRCNCVMKFSNPKDGIQEYHIKEKQSAYKCPYEAPEDGYLSTIEKYVKMTNGKAETNIIRETYKMNYIFRVRTKTDEKGNIIEAKYGKIIGDIAVAPGGSIEFSYYFNPSGNRSLEFDTEKNLFIPEGAKKWKEEYRNFTGFAP